MSENLMLRVEMVDDGVITGMRRRKRLGWVSRFLYPGYGSCHCCGMSWGACDSHATWVSEGSGCCPLCTWCWKRMSAERRLPFYRQHFERDHEARNLAGDWEAIRAAVLAEPGRRVA